MGIYPLLVAPAAGSEELRVRTGIEGILTIDGVYASGERVHLRRHDGVMVSRLWWYTVNGKVVGDCR